MQVYARFTQGLQVVYAGLRKVYARFMQDLCKVDVSLRKVYVWFMQGDPKTSYWPEKRGQNPADPSRHARILVR